MRVCLCFCPSVCVYVVVPVIYTFLEKGGIFGTCVWIFVFVGFPFTPAVASRPGNQIAYTDLWKILKMLMLCLRLNMMVKLPASDYFSFRGLLRQAENTVVLFYTRTPHGV